MPGVQEPCPSPPLVLRQIYFSCTLFGFILHYFHLFDPICIYFTFLTSFPLCLLFFSFFLHISSFSLLFLFFLPNDISWYTPPPPAGEFSNLYTPDLKSLSRQKVLFLSWDGCSCSMRNRCDYGTCLVSTYWYSTYSRRGKYSHNFRKTAGTKIEISPLW